MDPLEITQHIKVLVSQGRGFREFLLPGLNKVRGEWAHDLYRP
jgi:hypothetical protein